VFGLSQTLANLTRNRKKLEEQLRAAERVHARDADIVAPGFDEDRSFGSNPGNLRMLSYAPPRLAANPPLVVVLHGCAQTAADYNHGAGWSTLADRYGFVLLLPEQQRSNNSARCFNWFEPGDIQRGNHWRAGAISCVARLGIMDHGLGFRCGMEAPTRR